MHNAAKRPEINAERSTFYQKKARNSKKWQQLAKIAVNTAKTVKMFGIEPVIGILSFSNFGSSDSKEAEKISSAIKLLHTNNPDIIVDGPI